MKLVYNNMGHILRFGEGYVNELIIENKKMFFEVVDSINRQADGIHGDCVLSVSDRPVEFSKYADLTVQFAPFRINRKSLLTKLYNVLEKKSQAAEIYTKTGELLSELERYILLLSEDLPFEINCQKLAVGPIIRALSPEIEESDKSPIEKVFAYMELVRELDRDKLFIMVNMRSYFSDEEMEKFTESACLHDFKVLLLESYESSKLKHTKRYVVDNDLCEF
ncbi:MAG: type II-A CRISPR-associated protein Csn2 [Clostridia bacterium]|nr:type II-A CRISPR-associated protein Csn2 [Clostridia bacterium]